MAVGVAVKYLLPAALVLGLGVLLYRTLAIGQKQPLTLAEQRRAAFGALEPRYRQTQPGKSWKLRIARWAEGRKRA